MAAVRRFEPGDAPAVTAIIRGLPDYLTDDVPAKAERDADDHEAWLITDSGTVTGFAIAGHVLDHLAAGISVVEVKTPDRSFGYLPYEATGAFWERNGFVQVDTIDPLPGAARYRAHHRTHPQHAPHDLGVHRYQPAATPAHRTIRPRTPTLTPQEPHPSPLASVLPSF